MADVRSLLQNERASRRIAHPYARYSESGKLSCTLCDIFIKSDSAWKSHVRTPEHASRALRAAEAKAQHSSKKRKAGSDDEDTRKRVRGESESPGSEDQNDGSVVTRSVRFADDPKGSISAVDSESIVTHTRPAEPATETQSETDMKGTQPAPREEHAPLEDADNDPEWLEFQRTIRGSGVPSEGVEAHANATISAAPMTAEEVAAQAREEQSAQRGHREAEMDDEKEDAAQALEAEFDEMDELEERVRKLREKREALRESRDAGPAPSEVSEFSAEPTRSQLATAEQGLPAGLNGGRDEPTGEEVEDDEDGDDEDDDVWNFGAD